MSITPIRTPDILWLSKLSKRYFPRPMQPASFRSKICRDLKLHGIRTKRTRRFSLKLPPVCCQSPVPARGKSQFSQNLLPSLQFPVK